MKSMKSGKSKSKSRVLAQPENKMVSKVRPAANGPAMTKKSSAK